VGFTFRLALRRITCLDPTWTTYRLGSEPRSPRLTAGADLQRMRDNRQNFRAVSGVPTDSVLIDQREKITEFGPLPNPPGPRTSVSW
jgi:hypothetical protein